MSTVTPDRTPTEPTGKPEATASPESISRSEIFEVLSNDRRQYVVQCLLDRCEESALPLGEVVDYVAAREYDLPLGEIRAAQRKRVYTAVRQCHLPKLDKYGVVDFDNLRSEVGPGSALEDVSRYLEYDPRTAPSWGFRYLGLSLLAALVLSLSLGHVGPLGALAPETLTMAIVGTFAATAGVHTCRSGQPVLRNRDLWTDWFD